MRSYNNVPAGIIAFLLTGIMGAAPTASTAGLDSGVGRFTVTQEGQTYRAALRNDKGGRLAQPAEGLWSIAMGWENNWPARAQSRQI